jgi:hypothetical protein
LHEALNVAQAFNRRVGLFVQRLRETLERILGDQAQSQEQFDSGRRHLGTLIGGRGVTGTRNQKSRLSIV